MQVKINLNNRPDNAVNVDLQWTVDVLKDKSGILAKIFRKHNRINRPLRLNITNIQVPEDIVCRNSDELFSILYNSEIQTKFPVDITITDKKTPFQLLFHQEKITDCRRQQDANPRMYSITFTVELLEADKDNVIYTRKEKIDVIFEPLDVKPKFEINLKTETIQYSSLLQREHVGDVEVWIDEDFVFTPDQLVAITLKLYKVNGNEDVSTYISFVDRSQVKNLTITHGKENKINLPIYVDFTDIPNPIDLEEDYAIEISIVRAASYSPEIKEPIWPGQKPFTLLKDQQGTELNVFIEEPGGEPVLYNSSHLSCISQRISKGILPHSRLIIQSTVTLTNIATDDTNKAAGVYIKNLTLTEFLLDDVRVLGEDNTFLSQFIKIDGRDVEAMSSANGLFIPNGPKAERIITMSFDPSRIVDLQNANDYNFYVQSILTFDYYEDRDGVGINDLTKKEGKISIKWMLHLEPYPEWLCIDYGSSAIVCKYGQEILNLKEQKDDIFKNVNFSSDTFEKDTPFLSSDIVLHPVSKNDRSTLCSQLSKDDNIPYLELSVCLSPTSSLMKNDVNTQLPCLKILVGNEFLPEKGAYMTFQYTRLDHDNHLSTVQASEAKRRNEETCILRIANIFKEAYSTLFRYFIQPVSQDKSINKLVLTYPNTYTPVHLQMLEKIVYQTFPKVRPEYLRFVGESDAVATYYINNWDAYNKERNIAEDETVLVYDMGAGTLDITLFQKRQNEEGKIVVDILGKIGTGKAGNYLDYIICEIIKDEVAGAIEGKMIVSTQSVPDRTTQEARFNLKDKVKTDIKPNLKTNTDLEYGDISFSSKVILQNKQFKEFLQQITKGIIDRLLSYIGDEQTIDTVLMSGRSCRLEILHSKIKKAISDKYPDARIVKIDSIDDKEKTVVVEGAMARASIFGSEDSPVIIRSRRLYASYGLIYNVLGGRYQYTELLNSSSLPLVEDCNKLDDYEGLNREVIGIAADRITLIQTYLSEQDTEKAYNEGDLEFISVMEEYSMAEFNGANSLNVKLKLDYKNNISLYVNGKRSVGSPPKSIDLKSEITKRSIWPVTI